MSTGLNTQFLFDHLPDIATRVCARPHVLLFLDYDGTLAPIHEDPGRASMPAATRTAIKRLSAGKRFSVAIISGRALPDLRERVRLDELIFAGNHGLEILAPAMHFIEPSAARMAEELEGLSRHLQVRLRHIPGAEVEHKVLSASIHFRRAPEDCLKEIHRAVQSEVAPFESLFQVSQGLKVFEIRPRVNWHKGNAVRWILEATGDPNTLGVYVGDDLTDEDAFSMLPEGVTVRVGNNANTAAQYCIPKQESVQEFLAWLAELPEAGQAATA